MVFIIFGKYLRLQAGDKVKAIVEIKKICAAITAMEKTFLPRRMDDGQPDPDTPDIGGNRIVIKHSSGEYSAICHLKPGSVAVRKGQTVKKGDVIAKCGNSGNTTEPHVHFQVQSTARFYSSHGIPIHFSGIQQKAYEKYAIVDDRPLPEKEDIKNGYIHRRLLIRNADNK